MEEKTVLERTVEFLFEAGMLKKTPRTGYQFLGTGAETVAAHSFGALVTAFALAHLTPKADLAKVLQLVLFHDLTEARTGDFNYVAKRYVTADEKAALADTARGLPFGPEIQGLAEEFQAGQTLEALLAHDADQLDLALELREQENLGNSQARQWLHYSGQRLRTEAGRLLFERIIRADHTSWWFEKRDELWCRNP